MTQRTGIQALGSIIRGKVFILPVYLAILGMLIVATARSWIDFQTSLVGAEMLNVPTIGSATWDAIGVFSIAAMPQLVTIVFAYVALATPFNDQYKWLKLSAILILLISLTLDIYTGYLFYSPEARYPLAIAGILDTAFSEVMFTVAFGLALDLAPDARMQLSVFLNRLLRGIDSAIPGHAPRQQQRKSNQHKTKPQGKHQRNKPSGAPVRASQKKQFPPNIIEG